MEWWVASEQRWHHPRGDHTLRQRLVDGLPVVETAVRVPSGDVVGTAFAFAGSGGSPQLALGVRNDSPLPVAVAFVLGPASGVTVAGSEVRVGDEVAMALSRTPAVVVAADSLEGLRDAVVDATGISDAPLAGYVAVVVPVPHAQSCETRLGPFVDVDVAAPGVAQLCAGWASHLGRGAGWTIPSPDAERVRRAAAEVALGPLDRTDLGQVARNLRAVLHLGWFEGAADPTDVLLAAQRSKGAIGDDRATIDSLSALSAWRLSGVPSLHLEGVALATAAAARRVARRWQRMDPALRSEAREALEEAAAFLASVGEPQAAVPVPPPVSPPVRPESRRDRDDAASMVVGLVRGLVQDTNDGVELLGAWRLDWRGVSIEATDVPTRWGRVSFALRWHSERPALLWELKSWDPEYEAAPQFSAPAFDPQWVGHGRAGEVLLEANFDQPLAIPRRARRSKGVSGGSGAGEVS